MPSTVPFGIPAECAPFLEAVLDDLWVVAERDGPDAGLTWLDAEAEAGRVPTVVAEHVRVWNEAKMANPDLYVAAYVDYASEHRDDWARDGLDTPDFDAAFGPAWKTFSAPQPAPRPTQGRNERCACGSGQKFKFCCGR